MVHSKHFYCQRCFLNTFNYSLAASPNGWTDSDAALAWIRDVFDPETQPAVPGDKRLLIMDGHRSHCSLEFLLYAERKGITVLLLPPHTTVADRIKLYGTGRIRTNLATGLQCPRVLAATTRLCPVLVKDLTRRPHRNPVRYANPYNHPPPTATGCWHIWAP